MVLASSKVVHGWLRIITERWFQSVLLSAGVGFDVADHVKLLQSSWVTRSVNAITIFHFTLSNPMGIALSLSSRNILFLAGLYHITVILLFFPLFTDADLYIPIFCSFSFSFSVLSTFLVLSNHATHVRTFSFCNNSFNSLYQLQFCNSVGVSHPKLSDAQLSIKFFSGWEFTYFIT